MFFHDKIESVTVDINAPVSKVWEVLLDLDSYPEWNPFTVQIDADLSQLGSDVGLHVQMNPKKKIYQVEQLRVNDKEEQLSWGVTMVHPALLWAQRDQVLTMIDENTTRYVTVDVFKGLLVPLMMAFYGKDIKRGFDAIALALKARCET